MDQTFNWELSKENIQPLRHGRNASQLLLALNDDHAKQSRNDQRKAYESDIMAYNGDDPLEVWFRYIKWVEETYPQGGNESGLLTVLEKCLEKVRDHVQYQSDSRLLEVYLRYLDLTDSNVEWFQMLYAGGYFHKLAPFYINWADKLEGACSFKEATKIYQLAFQNGAEPHSKLDECFKKYQARVAAAILSGKTDENDEFIPSSDSRQAFGELEAVTDDHRVPTVRSGSSVLKFQGNRLLPLSSTSRSSNKQMTIHSDENNPNPSTALVPGRIAIPIHSTTKVENVHKATKWSEVAVFNEPVAVPAQPKIQVHVDEEAISHPTPRKAEASFTSVLRDKPVAPARFTPQMLFEAENPKVRLMCDLNKIYVANREFTFEEIRSQCCQRYGPKKTGKCGQVLVPLEEEPARVPLKPKITEPEKKVDPITAPIQPITAPVFNPREHLKPNERLHCHMDEMYTTDGKEFSFEQLRARIYARKMEKHAKVTPEVKAPAVVSEVQSLPPSLPPPVMCDACIQTDLAGLDYDIVLVPKAKPVPPPPSPSPEPPAERELDQTAAPSPTLNTKAALSNVKNWFNHSVLLDPKPHTKAPVEPPPVKKAAFAIFKDPSVMEPPQTDAVPVKKAGFAVYKDPTILEPAEEAPIVKKPAFAIFKDPTILEPAEEAPIVKKPPFAVFKDPSVLEPAHVDPAPVKKAPFTIFSEGNDAPAPSIPKASLVDPENVEFAPREAFKTRKALMPIEALKICDEAEDDFKENVAPCNYVQEKSDRQLAGILLPATNVPFDPQAVGEDVEEEEFPVAPSVHRVLFADGDDETRFFSAPVSDNVDFTIPSVAAFAKNLNRGHDHVQSTPFASREPPMFVDDDLTSVLLNRPKPQPPAPEVEATHKADPLPMPGKLRRRLSDIGEASHECYSSSGSSAGSTGLAYSRLSVGRSLHSHTHFVEPSAPVRIYPGSYDPFAVELRQQQLNTMATPLSSRSGFHNVLGRFPILRSNSTLMLDGRIYIIKGAIGQGAYAKIYEASLPTLGTPRIVLKVQDSIGGLWEFYVASELQRRLGRDSPVADAVMSVEDGFFNEAGSILVNQYLPYGNLLGLVNYFRLKNCSMPECLVFYLTLELLLIVESCHSNQFLHADIKADNIMLQRLPQLPHEEWTLQDVLSVEKPSLKLIDWGRSIDLSLYAEKPAFQHCFQDDKSPEMRDGKPWSYQLDYYGVATTVYTLLMGTHCKIIQDNGQWKVPSLKRGHNEIWRELTTELLNAPTSGVPLDLNKWRQRVALQFVSTKPKDFHEKVREVERYFASMKQ